MRFIDLLLLTVFAFDLGSEFEQVKHYSLKVKAKKLWVTISLVAVQFFVLMFDTMK